MTNTIFTRTYACVVAAVVAGACVCALTDVANAEPADPAPDLAAKLKAEPKTDADRRSISRRRASTSWWNRVRSSSG